MTYNQPRVITLAPKTIGIGILCAATLIGSYFFLREEPQKSQYKDVTLTLNKTSSYEIAQAIPQGKRKEIIHNWIKELSITEKLELVGPLAKDTLDKALEGVDQYSRQLFVAPTYDAFTPLIDAASAASQILKTLGGK